MDDHQQKSAHFLLICWCQKGWQTRRFWPEQSGNGEEKRTAQAAFSPALLVRLTAGLRDEAR